MCFLFCSFDVKWAREDRVKRSGKNVQGSCGFVYVNEGSEEISKKKLTLNVELVTGRSSFN
jgi:hypothetical protein